MNTIGAFHFYCLIILDSLQIQAVQPGVLSPSLCQFNSTQLIWADCSMSKYRFLHWILSKKTVHDCQWLSFNTPCVYAPKQNTHFGGFSLNSMQTSHVWLVHWWVHSIGMMLKTETSSIHSIPLIGTLTTIALHTKYDRWGSYETLALHTAWEARAQIMPEIPGGKCWAATVRQGQSVQTLHCVC